MITDDITTVPPDPRFSFKHAVHDGRTVIMSGEKSFIGKVIFDPGAACRLDDTCYSGIHLNSKTGKEWLQGLSLGLSVSENDVGLVSSLWNRLRTAVSPSSSFNITLNLDTNQVRGFLFKARARLVWPKMTPATLERLVFPLTQVGNSSVKEVTLSNPSEEPVLVHLVPMTTYPNVETLMIKLPIFKSPTEEFSNSSDFRVISAYDITTNSPLTGLGSLGVDLHSDTKGFILKAGSSAKIKIRFHPENVGHFKSGLIIRNNLTGLEFLEVFGEAVMGEIKFGKFKATPLTPATTLEKAILEFDMKEKHLKGCTQPRDTKTRDQPMYTVKRSFKAKNSGLTSLYIQGFDIEGQSCEGYGFKILNCESFNLAPNETREIHVAFTPDFTLSRISRKMTMTTSMKHLEKINYTLVATVPSHMLSLCSKTLPRPYWESYIFWALNGLMIGFIVIIICAAGYDADRILNAPYFSPIMQFDEQGQLLDLRQVADLVRKELNSDSRLGHSHRNLIQDIPKHHHHHNNSNAKSSIIPRKVPKFLSSIRAILRAIGVSILSMVWRGKNEDKSVPPNVDQHKQDSEDEEEETIKDVILDKDAKGNSSQNQPNQNKNKNKSSNKKSNAVRKKSLTDLDEASSTTTESSTLDDLNDSKSSLDLVLQSSNSSSSNNNKSKSNKKQSKQPPNHQVISNAIATVKPTEHHQPSSQQQQSKKKSNKSTKTMESSSKKSPERPVMASATVNSNPVKIQEVKKSTPPKSTSDVSNKQQIEPQQSQPQQQQQQQVFTGNSNGNPSNIQIVEQQPKKVKQVGKILPEIKKPENHGAQFGPVGAKPLKPAWQDDPPPTSFMAGNSNSEAERYNQHPSNGSSPSRQPGQPSFMTQMQLNRREETAKYVAGMNNDWPGFDPNTPTNLVQDLSDIRNLWDNQQSPLAQADNNIWSSGLWTDMGK